MILASVGLVLAMPLARRISVPFPVLLTVLGIVAALVPGIDHVDIDTESLLPILLPPILWAAASRTSFSHLKRHAGPIVGLAVGLVVVSALMVGALLTWLLPNVPWALAFAVGAALAPPDPVAATSVASRIGLPHRVVNVLEGEGLVNDATSLTLFNAALAAATAGAALTWTTVVSDFALGVVLGVAVGLAVAWLARFVIARLDDVPLERAFELILPFAAYVVAEDLHGSGVLAVLVAGLGVSHSVFRVTSAESRLARESLWEALDLLTTGVAFVIIGLEIRVTFQDNITQARNLITAAVVCASLVILRLCWLSFSGAVRPARFAGQAPANWREGVVMGWAGMRGVVTIAAVLAMPSDVEQRDALLFVTFVVVLTTLVIGGTTLPMVARWVRVGESDPQAQLRRIAEPVGRAMLTRIDELNANGELSEEQRERLHRGCIATLAAIVPGAAKKLEEKLELSGTAKKVRHGRQARLEILQAAQDEALHLRADETFDPRLVDQVLHRIDRGLLNLE